LERWPASLPAWTPYLDTPMKRRPRSPEANFLPDIATGGCDPDGNGWLLQEIRGRLPGRATHEPLNGKMTDVIG
jgi:hypothetical protein